MHHAPAINIWKGSNRVSRLWEDLLADRVSPDPCAEENILLRADPDRSFSQESYNLKEKSTASWGEQDDAIELPLLEKAGFESLRLIRHALEILTAPPEQESAVDTGWEQTPEAQLASQLGLEGTALHDLVRADSAVGLTFIKVSSEPEPQTASTIDTRRMAYGLKIPVRPLHKRPIYQRVFFCLRNMFSRGEG